MNLVLKQGLKLSVEGKPVELTDRQFSSETVSFYAPSFINAKLLVLVHQGDSVRLGDPIVASKDHPGVVFTSPATGVVKSINRGEKRSLIGVEISVDANSKDERQFDLSGDVKKDLIMSGLFTLLRRRPFDGLIDPNEEIDSIFINSMDLDPLGFKPEIIIQKHWYDYVAGINALAKLCHYKVFNCFQYGALRFQGMPENFEAVNVKGNFPASLTGTHIHHLRPLTGDRVHAQIDYQDVIAIGKFLESGKIWNYRYVGVGGPLVKNPMIALVPVGADIEELLKHFEVLGKRRVISGSIFAGHTAINDSRFLGAFDRHISIIKEDDERVFLGWIRPGVRSHSLTNSYLSSFISKFLKNYTFDISTALHGGVRPIVPSVQFEEIFPFRILPVRLCQALLMRDLDRVVDLGGLELIEEDVAVLTYACSGKNDYGKYLREVLNKLRKEGV